MATDDLRTDSSDYRVELLSPEAAAMVPAAPREPTWQLNMDQFRLAERHMNSNFGCGSFWQTLSMHVILILFIESYCA